MKRRRIVIACWFVLALSGLAWTQPVGFRDVKARFSKSVTDRHLVDTDADLILDDSARKLIVKNREHPVEVGYDDIQKVVFDVSTHMRGSGGFMGRLAGGFGAAGGLAQAAISAKRVNDYWCYLEYKGPDGAVRHYMLEIPKESSSKVIEKMQALFRDKVVIADFTEKAEEIKKETLKDLESRHDLTVDERNHPMPESKPDKALVVVVSPPLKGEGKGTQVKLHANDRVVAVNRIGTYTFVYLDPGDYLLVSQGENASGFGMKLEAGSDYYFFQDALMGKVKNGTSLSRHTKELVMYEVSGADYSDWKRK